MSLNQPTGGTPMQMILMSPEQDRNTDTRIQSDYARSAVPTMQDFNTTASLVLKFLSDLTPTSSSERLKTNILTSQGGLPYRSSILEQTAHSIAEPGAQGFQLLNALSQKARNSTSEEVQRNHVQSLCIPQQFKCLQCQRSLLPSPPEANSFVQPSWDEATAQESTRRPKLQTLNDTAGTGLVVDQSCSSPSEISDSENSLVSPSPVEAIRPYRLPPTGLFATRRRWDELRAPAIPKQRKWQELVDIVEGSPAADHRCPTRSENPDAAKAPRGLFASEAIKPFRSPLRKILPIKRSRDEPGANVSFKQRNLQRAIDTVRSDLTACPTCPFRSEVLDGTDTLMANQPCEVTRQSKKAPYCASTAPRYHPTVKKSSFQGHLNGLANGMTIDDSPDLAPDACEPTSPKEHGNPSVSSSKLQAYSKPIRQKSYNDNGPELSLSRASNKGTPGSGPTGTEGYAGSIKRKYDINASASGNCLAYSTPADPSAKEKTRPQLGIRSFPNLSKPRGELSGSDLTEETRERWPKRLALPPLRSPFESIRNLDSHDRWAAQRQYRFIGYLPPIMETRYLAALEEGGTLKVVTGVNRVGPPLKPLDGPAAEGIAIEQQRAVLMKQDVKAARLSYTRQGDIGNGIARGPAYATLTFPSSIWYVARRWRSEPAE